LDLKEKITIGAEINSHWYYTSKARMMADHVMRLPGARPVECVIDVGAGAGWFSRQMLRDGLACAAVCVDPGYLEDRDETEAGRPIAFRCALDAAEIEKIGQVDLVLMMDVLEHVEDDDGLLSHYLNAVPAGTPFFITVPAFEMLWSAHDVYLEHYRRYTLPRLERTIRDAGAIPVSMHYFFGLIFPAVAMIRLLRRKRPATRSDMAPISEPLNTMLKGICAVEQKLMRINRLAGVSVVALCHRPV